MQLQQKDRYTDAEKWLRNLGEKDNKDIQQMAASVARQDIIAAFVVCLILFKRYISVYDCFFDIHFTIHLTASTNLCRYISGATATNSPAGP